MSLVRYLNTPLSASHLTIPPRSSLDLQIPQPTNLRRKTQKHTKIIL
jgi:hypothetical protein